MYKVVGVLTSAFGSDENENHNFDLFGRSNQNGKPTVADYNSNLLELQQKVASLHTAVIQFATEIKRVLLATFQNGAFDESLIVDGRKRVTSNNNIINMSKGLIFDFYYKQKHYINTQPCLKCNRV